MNRDNANESQIRVLLESDLLLAPEDFSKRVLREIEVEAFTADAPHSTTSDKNATIGMLQWWQWLAVAAGSLIGMAQVSRFIFGFWLSAAVG